MGLFEFFNSYDEEEKRKRRKELEEEMDDLGLDDWEKDEVRENGWDPEDFDDDELEEGDYYYEDDN